jgi:hypothetical protein
MSKQRLLLLGFLFAFGFGVPLTFASSSQNPKVLPPQSHAFGKTYGGWSAAFWQWEYSLPIDHHPLFDTADCNAGQSGKVFFLGGTFTVTQNGITVTGVANRTCTIPAGKAIFFPIINGECSTLEGNGSTDQALRSCAKGVIDGPPGVTELQAVLDGVSIKNLRSYRAQSPLFTFGPLPDNNILQAFGISNSVGQTTASVSDGYYLLLAPLSIGQHDLHFSGRLELGSPVNFIFSEDITYHLTVLSK